MYIGDLAHYVYVHIGNEAIIFMSIGDLVLYVYVHRGSEEDLGVGGGI